MSESDMRSYLVKSLEVLDAVAIENGRLRAGTPDLNFIGGWIECKWLKTWPKGADVNPVRFQHPLTKEQGLWLARRWRRGGLALVAAKVSSEWFFFSGETARHTFDRMTRPQMREQALLWFPRGLDKERLIEWLRSNRRI